MCAKCQHNLYVDKKKVSKVLKLDCPNCGEEPYENWCLIGEGNFDVDLGGKPRKAR